MSPRDLDLRVLWPDQRTVNVHIDVEPDVADRGDFGPQSLPERDESFFPIHAGALDSREALITFLKQATGGKASGATVTMLLREPDESTLLTLLRHKGPVTGPITIEVS